MNLDIFSPVSVMRRRLPLREGLAEPGHVFSHDLTRSTMVLSGVKFRLTTLSIREEIGELFDSAPTACAEKNIREKFMQAR